jgi:hypothetical protein
MKHKVTFALGVFCGLLAAAWLSGPNSHAQPAKDGPLVRVDESKMVITYANAYRIHTTSEEVILDLGLNMPNPNAAPNSGELLFNVTNRVVMTYPNAKKLSASLAELVKRYESQFGEISPPKPERK